MSVMIGTRARVQTPRSPALAAPSYRLRHVAETHRFRRSDECVLACDGVAFREAAL